MTKTRLAKSSVEFDCRCDSGDDVYELIVISKATDRR